MKLFYQPGIPYGIRFLNEEESRHCVKVLRHKVNDTIHITDGIGNFYDAKIIEANAKKCEFEVEQNYEQAKRDYYLHIAIAPTKNIDRIEWFVEKTVEIGIDEISFILCKHSERKNINIERIRRKAIMAMKQSLKARLPIINELEPIGKFWSKDIHANQKFIGFVDEKITKPITDLIELKRRYLIMIGPEGDFSPEEISESEKIGYQPIGLGSSRLRTETAGLVACQVPYLIHM